MMTSVVVVQVYRLPLECMLVIVTGWVASALEGQLSAVLPETI